MSRPLILSLFPVIDGLGRGFAEAWPEACIVRGPDLLWGGDARNFHVPVCRFDGIVGGPPCQKFTRLRHLNPKCGEKHGNLIPEFERCVAEGMPSWFLMENVPEAPEPKVKHYHVSSLVINNRWFGAEQNRERRFSFGVHEVRIWEGARCTLDIGPDLAVLESLEYRQAVTSKAGAVPVKIGGSGKIKRTYIADGKCHGPSDGTRMPISEMALAQGFPADFLSEAPFTAKGKRLVIGNAVPRWMAVAVAKAVHRAMEAL